MARWWLRSGQQWQPRTLYTSPHRYTMYDDFSRYSNGQVPDIALTGHVWGQYSGPGYVTDGYYDSVEGTGASYMEVDMGGEVTRFGARFRLDTMGGTRTGLGGTLCLATWADGGYVLNGPGRRTRCHFVIHPRGASYYVRDVETVAAGALVNIQNWGGTFATDVEHTVEVRLDGTTATVDVNDGEWVRSITDPRIAHREGETFPCWEPFYNNDGTDVRARIAEVWCDGAPAQ